MDKVRWITAWILAGETAANSLIRNRGSEGRETLSRESESEHRAQWAPETCAHMCVCWGGGGAYVCECVWVAAYARV